MLGLKLTHVKGALDLDVLKTTTRTKLIMTQGWRPLGTIENESILTHVDGALKWSLTIRLIETSWLRRVETSPI